MLVTSVIAHTRTAFRTAVTDLNASVAKLFPTGENPKVVNWGADNGVYDKLNSAANALEQGLDGLSEIYTRRQGRELFTQLQTDIDNIFQLRNVAMTVADGDHMSKYTAAPVLNEAAKGDLLQAVAHARSAVALLSGRA